MLSFDCLILSRGRIRQSLGSNGLTSREGGALILAACFPVRSASRRSFMTQPQPVTHLAFIRASNGRSAELGMRLRDLLEPSLRAPGCLSFSVQRSQVDADLWLLSGSWSDQQAMSGYFASPTLEVFGELVQAQVVSSLDLHTFA
jgi:quinol monooxygenase YgiN